MFKLLAALAALCSSLLASEPTGLPSPCQSRWTPVAATQHAQDLGLFMLGSTVPMRKVDNPFAHPDCPCFLSGSAPVYLNGKVIAKFRGIESGECAREDAEPFLCDPDETEKYCEVAFTFYPLWGPQFWQTYDIFYNGALVSSGDPSTLIHYAPTTLVRCGGNVQAKIVFYDAGGNQLSESFINGGCVNCEWF